MDNTKELKLRFVADPEADNPYFTVCDANGKTVGRSNRRAALRKLQYQIKYLKLDGYTVKVDGHNEAFPIGDDGLLYHCGIASFEDMWPNAFDNGSLANPRFGTPETWTQEDIDEVFD